MLAEFQEYKFQNISHKHKKSKFSMYKLNNYLKLNWWVIILCGILLISLFCIYFSIKFYFVQFSDYSLSDEPEKWGVFGDYIGGTLNPILTIINIVITIWLTVIINRFGNRNSERQIDAARKIAKLQLRNEALKELRININTNFDDLKASSTIDSVELCQKTLNNFAFNYSYLFDILEIESYYNLMNILEHIKTQLLNSSSIIVIQEVLQAEMGRQELLSDLGEAVLE
jgi:hypothetical protein